MGGKGSGGKRPGSGSKSKSAIEKELGGNAGHRGRVLAGPGAGRVPMVAAIEPVEPPADLASEERAVWDSLAAHAVKARTLMPATALAFRLLCQNVVMERLMAKGSEPGGANHRGIIQRVESGLGAFNLRPFGKPIYEAEDEAKPANPLERFLRKG